MNDEDTLHHARYWRQLNWMEQGRLVLTGDLPVDPDDALRQLAVWVEAGVTHIVDARMEWSDEDLVAEVAPHIRYLHNGADDAGQRMPDDWFDRAVDFALAALDSPEAKVLVHCHMGINRGPSLAYAVLLALGVDPVEALDAIRSTRPIAAVGYAEDALRWHHRRTGAGAAVRALDRSRVSAWRRAHPLEVVRIIRQIRAVEAACDPSEPGQQSA